MLLLAPVAKDLSLDLLEQQFTMSIGLLLHVTNSSLHHGYDVIGSLGSTEMMSSLIDSDVM